MRPLILIPIFLLALVACLPRPTAADAEACEAFCVVNGTTYTRTAIPNGGLQCTCEFRASSIIATTTPEAPPVVEE